MFDAADASDAWAAGVMPGANETQISDAAIKSDLKMMLSLDGCPQKCARLCGLDKMSFFEGIEATRLR